MAREMVSEVAREMASEVPKWRESSQDECCCLVRNIGESCEEWKSRLESRWDSIIHKMRATQMGILKETNTMDDPCFIDVTSIISRDDLVGLQYDIDDNVICFLISDHGDIKSKYLPIMIKDLPITESTPPLLNTALLNKAALHHSFQVIEILLSSGVYSGSQVEHCLDIALSSAWDTLENVTSVVCSEKSPELAINCFKLIATLCLPQMKPALSTLHCFACFMSDEAVAKEACSRAMQGRFLDYALLLMVAPRQVLDFTDRSCFLDGLRSKMSSSEWPEVFHACIFLSYIFSSVNYDFYEYWQSSERLMQKGVVYHVYSTCKRVGLPVPYNDIKLLDAHTLRPQPKLSDADAKFAGPTTYPRILGPDDPRQNIYPSSFKWKLLSPETSHAGLLATNHMGTTGEDAFPMRPPISE